MIGEEVPVETDTEVKAERDDIVQSVVIEVVVVKEITITAEVGHLTVDLVAVIDTKTTIQIMITIVIAAIVIVIITVPETMIDPVAPEAVATTAGALVEVARKEHLILLI